MVASALAQEGVSRASSYISTKLEEKASTAENMARLEMALSRMEFFLESAGKIPITSIALLRRVKILKSAHAEGTDLLSKHKLRVLQEATGGRRDRDDEAAGRAVTRYYPLPLREWFGRARKLRIISALIGLDNDDHLSSATVRTYEWYADCADKFVADVESANPLGRGTFRYQFVWELLEGKTLWYTSKRGSPLIDFCMVPLHSDDRGVEAELWYFDKDLRKTENSFCVHLVLRLSESTDIVGTAIKCLNLLTSQLKLVIESAVGELTLLPDLQDVSHSYAPPRFVCPQDTYLPHESWRPDPICCCSPVDSPNQVPEPVIYFLFVSCVSAPEYSLRNRNAPAPPLYLVALFAPHFGIFELQPTIQLKYGDKVQERSGCGVEQVEEIVGSSALDYLVLEPEPTDYTILWFSGHGVVFIILSKSSNEEARPKPTPAPRRGRSAAKRKR